MLGSTAAQTLFGSAFRVTRERGKILKVTSEEGYFRVAVKTATYRPVSTPSLEQLVQRVTSLFEQYVKLSQNLNYETMIAAVKVEEVGKFTDTVAANLNISLEEKQELLEIFEPVDRLTRLADILDIEIEKLNVDRTIQGRGSMPELAPRTKPSVSWLSCPARSEPAASLTSPTGRRSRPHTAACRSASLPVATPNA